MAQEYRDQGIPTYIFAHNIDDTAPFVRQRASRWREAAGIPPGEGATLPLVLVNSGHETTQNSHADFRKDYTKMIEAAGQGGPTAEVSAQWHKVSDNSVGLSVTVKNTGELAFDPFEGGNGASLLVFAVEHAKVIHLNYYAQNSQVLDLPDVLKAGQSVTVETEIPIRASSMKRFEILAALEYKGTGGKWDLAQGVKATEAKPDGPPVVDPPVTDVTSRLFLPMLHRGVE